MSDRYESITFPENYWNLPDASYHTEWHWQDQGTWNRYGCPCPLDIARQIIEVDAAWSYPRKYRVVDNVGNVILETGGTIIIPADTVRTGEVLTITAKGTFDGVSWRVEVAGEWDDE